MIKNYIICTSTDVKLHTDVLANAHKLSLAAKREYNGENA